MSVWTRKVLQVEFVGYARTSTTEQVAGLEAQQRCLLDAGVHPDHMFSEQVSSVAKRDALGCV